MRDKQWQAWDGQIRGCGLVDQGLTAKNSISVSIIMPAYNAQTHIKNAIRSVQAQTFSDFEIIVIDDASTDATARAVHELCAEDARIRYARMEMNAGPAASRNRGLDLARGEWIALLDADDRFHPDRLKTLLSLGEREGADVVSDNITLLKEGEKAGERMIPESILFQPRVLPFPEFIAGCHYNAQTPSRVRYVFMHPVFRREFLVSNCIRYNELSRVGEDFLFYIDCYLNNAKWYIEPNPMYMYTIRRGSLTESASDQDHYRVVEKMRDVLKVVQHSDDIAVRNAIKKHWKLVASDYYYYGLKKALRATDYKGIWRAIVCDKDALRLIIPRLLSRGPKVMAKLISGHRLIAERHAD